MQVILNKEQIEAIETELVDKIVSDIPKGTDFALIGIRSRGEIFAQRLAKKIGQKLGQDVSCGTLDITLYRDDINQPQAGSQLEVRETEIGFSIDAKVIFLVDDVLYTGRSTRAALDALIDLGRPKQIRLAVLVERAGREFPIQADFIGYRAKADEDQFVQVNFIESDGKDEVTKD